MKKLGRRGFGVSALVIGLAASAANAAPPAKPSFVPLGETYLVPMDMSWDGTVIVGRGYFGAPTFRYTASEGVQILGGGCGSGTASVSGDGSTIVSCMTDEVGIDSAAKWLGGSDWQWLGSVEGAVNCDANLSSTWDVDGDGSTAVGLVWLPQLCRAHAGAWDLVNGGPATDLGSLVADRATRANAISGDGHVIGGWQDDEVGQRQGAIWRDGVEEDVLTEAGDHVGEVAYVNYDGTVLAGANLPYGTPNAWVWTAHRGFSTIDAPGPLWQIFVTQASDDGSVAVGIARSDTSQKGFIWKAQGGKLIWTDDYLAKNGLAEGWQIGSVTAISADGETLAGYGLNPDGDVEGFILENFK